eukprot:177737-Pyramimonas_sp.AAC.1
MHGQDSRVERMRGCWGIGQRAGQASLRILRHWCYIGHETNYAGHQGGAGRGACQDQDWFSIGNGGRT